MNHTVKLMNFKVGYDKNRGRVWHAFDVLADGMADDEQALAWYERSDRVYEAVANTAKNNEWQDMFGTFADEEDPDNLFAEAKGEMPLAGTCKHMKFTIHDIPEVAIERGSRTLDFVIVVKFASEEYVTACRQIITILDGFPIRADFQTTGFVKIKIDKDPEIKGDIVCKNLKLDDLISEWKLGRLETVSALFPQEGGKANDCGDRKVAAEVDKLLLKEGSRELILELKRISDYRNFEQNNKLQYIKKTEDCDITGEFKVKAVCGPCKMILK